MLKPFARAASALCLAMAVTAPAMGATTPVSNLGPGLVGVYYPPAKAGGPVALVLGGSEGGFAGSGALAKALSDEGIGALALAYFRSPGTTPTLEEVPLETFTRGLDWLAARPEVGKRRVAIVGVSKGAEAGLLTASRDRRVCAVVAAVPSNVVWAGYNPASNMGSMKASWSAGGKPLEYARYDFTGFVGGLRGVYEKSLKKAPPAAEIPVEKIAGPVLLISGREDKLWPSTPMADAVMARFDRAKFPYAHSHLAYDSAGHAAFGKPAAADAKVNPAMFAQAGGTFEGTNAARLDNWPKALVFLRTNLAAKGCAR